MSDLNPGYDVRLRRYTPGGDAGPILPVQSIDYTAPYCGIPTLTFDAAEVVIGTIPDVLEVAVEVWDGELWKEPKNGRFLLLSRNGNDMDPALVKSITCVSLHSYLLSKAEVVTEKGVDYIAKGSAGLVMGSLFRVAQDRGWGGALSIDFTDGADSNGVPWTVDATLDMTIADGTKLAAALQSIADQGGCEFSTTGRTLHLYNPATGNDLSEGVGMVQVGAASSELPVQTSNQDLATHVIIRGEEGASWVYPVPGAQAGLGRLEVSVDAPGVTTEANASRFAEAIRLGGASPMKQFTITEPAVDMTSRPFVQYQAGDWISARRPGGWQRMRVVQVQIRKSAENTIDIDTIVNDIVTDTLTRLAKSNRALGARLAIQLGTTNTTPLPDGTGGGDTLNPGAGWGSEGFKPGTVPGATAPAFKIHNITMGTLGEAENGAAIPMAHDNTNLVFGTTGTTKCKEVFYPPYEMQGHPSFRPDMFDAGGIDLRAGFLDGGGINDWGRHSYLYVDKALTGQLFQNNSLNMPPGQKWTGLEFSSYFCIEQTIKGGPRGECFAVAGYLYIPIACSVTWELWKSPTGNPTGTWEAVPGERIVATRTRFIRLNIQDYQTLNQPTVIDADLDTFNNTDFKFLRTGTRIGIIFQGSGGIYTADFGSGDPGPGHWSKLPGSGLVESDALHYAVASSTDGSGISIFAVESAPFGGGTGSKPVKELQIKQDLSAREVTSTWQTHSSLSADHQVSGITTRAGRIVLGTHNGQWLSFDKTAGFIMIGDAQPSGQTNQFSDLVPAFSYGGYVYHSSENYFDGVISFSSALLEPIENTPDPEI